MSLNNKVDHALSQCADRIEKLAHHSKIEGRKTALIGLSNQIRSMAESIDLDCSEWQQSRSPYPFSTTPVDGEFVVSDLQSVNSLRVAACNYGKRHGQSWKVTPIAGTKVAVVRRVK